MGSLIIKSYSLFACLALLLRSFLHKMGAQLLGNQSQTKADYHIVGPDTAHAQNTSQSPTTGHKSTHCVLQLGGREGREEGGRKGGGREGGTGGGHGRREEEGEKGGRRGREREGRRRVRRREEGGRRRRREGGGRRREEEEGGGREEGGEGGRREGGGRGGGGEEGGRRAGGGRERSGGKGGGREGRRVSHSRYLQYLGFIHEWHSRISKQFDSFSVSHSWESSMDFGWIQHIPGTNKNNIIIPT